MNEWTGSLLGEVAEVQTGPFGSQLHRRDYKPVGTPIITVEHLGDNRITYQNLPLVGDEDKERLSKYKIIKGDIVFSRVGSVDRRAYVSSKEDGWMFSGRLLRVRADKNVINPRFLSYYFGQERFKEHIRRIAVGATMPSINTTILSEVEIFYPPIPEQKAIAAVLSSLDDKINLLQRQNQTLEELAQTLFRQWFIEEVQDEWGDGCLGDVAENIRDSVKHDKVSNGTIYIGLEHIDKENIALSRNGLSDDVKSNKYKFLEEDILFGKLRPYFHKVCFTPFSGICSTDILVLRPKKPSYFCFGLFAFFQKDVVEYANLGSGGTRMPRTNWNILKEYPIALPPDGVLEQFNSLIHPSIEKIKHNLAQIRTLEKLRDTLLPKLMSGKARVRL